MPLELSLQLVQTVAVVTGIVFGLIQLRQLRDQREIQAGVELLHPLQSPEMAETVLLIYGLPDDLPVENLRAHLGDKFGALVGLLATFESLGPLVARGHVPIDMYAQFYRGPTVMCWRKLHRFVERRRQEGWHTLYEWAQWLAERMEERSSRSADVPAYEQFRAWRTSSDYRRLSAQSRHVSSSGR